MFQRLPAFVLASISLSPAFANVETQALDEVVVSASRRAAVSDEVSNALSLIGQDEVLRQKLVTDALQANVGVYLQQTTPGQGAAIIRGLKGSAILHLVDGMPLSNAIFRSAPTPYLALVPTTAVERVEVIRGTPASLYGSQAVGGVIQVVSRMPSFNSESMEFRRDVALSFDTADLTQSVKGSFDFGNQRLATSLSGEYLSTGDRRTGSGNRISPTGFTSQAARLAMVATPGGPHAWHLDLQFLEQPETPRIDELVAGFGQAQPSSSEFFFRPSRRAFARAGYRGVDTLLGLDWKIDLAWQRLDDDRKTRDFEAPTRTFESNSSDLKAFSISAAGESTDIKWISGLDVHHDEVGSSRVSEAVGSGETISVPARFPDGSRIEQAAIFGNFDWLVSERLQLTGGLRFTDVGIIVPETNSNEKSNIDVQRWSGDIGSIFSFGNSWSLVANAGFGFRAPNISDLGTLGNRPGNRFNIPNTDLREETVQQFDIGVRRSMDGFRFELMAYTLQYDDRITSITTGDTTPGGRDIVQSVNAASSSIHGAEAGLDVQLTSGIAATAVVNYTWGSEIIGDEDKQPADRIPPLSGKFELRVDLNENWLIESWLSFAGEQDRLSDRDIRDVRINPNGTPGWAILGTRANWMPDDKWMVSIAVDNLLDKRYRVHGSGIDSIGRNLWLMTRATW